MKQYNENGEPIGRCGHTSDTFHGIANHTGKKFWGDVCDACFCEIMQITQQINSSGYDWKWDSLKSEQHYKKIIVEKAI